MLRTVRRYLWPEADVAERVSTVLSAVTAAIAIALAVLDWTDWLDITSNLTFSLLVFAGGVVLLSFLVEAERRRAYSRELRSMQQSLDRARAAFGMGHDPQSARQIPGDGISDVLDGILAASSTWLFRGGSARYQRGAVLPKLAEVKTADVRYQIQILDPRDQHLCDAYAEYRRQARPAAQKLPTEDAAAIRNEILATLYAAGWYRNHSRIRPQVALMNSYSPIRVDIGSTGAVLTVANHLEPALLAPSGSFMYSAIKDEIEQAGTVLPRVNIPADLALFPAERSAVTGAVVEAALQRMTAQPAGSATNEPLLNGIGAVDFDAVAGRVFSPSPY